MCHMWFREDGLRVYSFTSYLLTQRHIHMPTTYQGGIGIENTGTDGQVQVFMCVYIHTHLYFCIYIYTGYIYIYMNVNTCLHVISLERTAGVVVHVCAILLRCIYICVHTFCLYTCMYIYVCIHINAVSRGLLVYLYTNEQYY